MGFMPCRSNQPLRTYHRSWIPGSVFKIFAKQPLLIGNHQHIIVIRLRKYGHIRLRRTPRIVSMLPGFFLDYLCTETLAARLIASANNRSS